MKWGTRPFIAPQERRLARAGRPDDEAQLAFVDREVDVAQDRSRRASAYVTVTPLEADHDRRSGAAGGRLG